MQRMLLVTKWYLSGWYFKPPVRFPKPFWRGFDIPMFYACDHFFVLMAGNKCIYPAGIPAQTSACSAQS
jgi:hypothetical protein